VASGEGRGGRAFRFIPGGTRALILEAKMARFHCSRVVAGEEHALCQRYRPPAAPILCGFAAFLIAEPADRCVRCERELLRMGIWNAYTEPSAGLLRLEASRGFPT